MRRSILSLVLVLAFVFPTAAGASSGLTPVGACPPGFELHEFMAHTDHEQHLGLTVDLNGNGFICVKPLANGLHVHVDDVLRSNSQSAGSNLLQAIFRLLGWPW